MNADTNYNMPYWFVRIRRLDGSVVIVEADNEDDAIEIYKKVRGSSIKTQILNARCKSSWESKAHD